MFSKGLDIDKADIDYSSRGSLLPEDLESTPAHRSEESQNHENLAARANRVGSVFDMRKDVQRIL